MEKYFSMAIETRRNINCSLQDKAKSCCSKVTSIPFSVVKNLWLTQMNKILVIDDDIPGAIDKYIKSKKGDLLTTFTHELNLFEKIFARSITRKLD